MKVLIKEEKGTAIIMLALMMVVLSGFVAFAIDGGNLYFHHTRLQDIADACALAACHQLGETEGDKTAAFDEAVSYAAKNGLKINSTDNATYSAAITYESEPDETGTMKVTSTTNKVKVEISVNSNLYFARILKPDFNQTPVNVSATASLGMVTEYTGGFAPLCFFWDETPTTKEYILNLQPGSGENGNYGYLDYDKDDDNSFYEDLKYGYNGTLKKGDTVSTYTGADVGQLEKAIEYRIDYCKTHHTADPCMPGSFVENCPRIVIIPIVEKFFGEDTTGKSEVVIAGFAQFFIKDYIKNSDGTKKTLIGEFIKPIDQDSVTGGVPKYDYLMESVKLIN